VPRVERFVLDRSGLDALIAALSSAGYRVLGPTVREGAIVYGDVAAAADLPVGWTDVQGPGSYRLERRADDRCFGFVVGPHSLKTLLFPPRRTLWNATREDGELRFIPSQPSDEPLAVVGVRSCELAAMAVQDHVLIGERYQDPDYVARRSRLFVVAVDCTDPGETCFCTSMGTGPGSKRGFDLALVEVLDEYGHRFVGRVGSDLGSDLLENVPHITASDAEVRQVGRMVSEAAERMGRAMRTAGLQELLADHRDAARWDEVAERCLACGNCTQVCPTCFCTTTEDVASLDAAEASRSRRWDTCFSLDFSYMGGKPQRTSIKGRYRHWLTHKLSTWIDQFGESGCVGCGRCIVWCPVGIDLTEEVAAIRREVGADA
jgi:sulfhydrogenase subunit beta (sulfur reductase)